MQLASRLIRLISAIQCNAKQCNAIQRNWQLCWSGHNKKGRWSSADHLWSAPRSLGRSQLISSISCNLPAVFLTIYPLYLSRFNNCIFFRFLENSVCIWKNWPTVFLPMISSPPVPPDSLGQPITHLINWFPPRDQYRIVQRWQISAAADICLHGAWWVCCLFAILTLDKIPLTPVKSSNRATHINDIIMLPSFWFSFKRSISLPIQKPTPFLHHPFVAQNSIKNVLGCGYAPKIINVSLLRELHESYALHVLPWVVLMM